MLESLQETVGNDNVLTDDAARVFFAQDVFTRGLPAMAVVRPANREELAAVVAAVTRAGHAIIARGGGMSYTSGFVPSEEGSVIVDMQRMDRVLEINAEDMYVTVEAGCSWQHLHEQLAGRGLRTPYWGTLSGIHATVGGSVSQNSIFWGSARHGSAADSVLGVEVVLADGSVVTTGAGAQKNSTPFFRHYGPDLTGLFSCDNGALGLKATVTLRLLPVCEHRQGISFDFSKPADLIAAMSVIGRSALVDECFAFDPGLQAVRMQRESLMNDVKKFAGVLKSGNSLLESLKDGAKVALAGRSFMQDVQYSMHVSIEERTAAAAAYAAEQVRHMAAEHNGREIENSIPKVLRANPFTPLNNMVGPNGERWTPVHCLLPHSKAKTVFDATLALFKQNETTLEQHGIAYGLLLTIISTNCFVLEPVFFTPDELLEIHRATVEPAVLKKLPGFAPNPAAMVATRRLRQQLIELFSEAGGVHLQIGKAYPYRAGLRAESWRLVEAVKKAVDPDGRVNPGALGFD